MAEVILENIAKRYGAVEVVRDLSLRIHNGEFLVLIGPSGCGKSTTLRMVAGLEPISGGRLRFGNKVVNTLPPKDRDIAMVFQSYALYPHMNVFDNMAFGLKLKGLARDDIQARVENAARILNIHGLLHRKPRELSGGQRQRVAMGRAIVRQPQAFLFDEPLSNLDAALRAQMRVEIKRLHQKLKTTMIYVTHDQIEAMTLADRIVIMNGGDIVQIGRPMEVYRNPVDKFVAGFIGAPRMNFIPAKLERSNGRLVFVLVDGTVLPVVGSHQAYQRYIGRNVEVGLRPEHLSVAGAGRGEQATFDALVEVVEPMGAQSQILLDLGGVEVSALCDPQDVPEAGRRATFTANLSEIHLIDAETGKVVPKDPAAGNEAGLRLAVGA